MSDNIVIVSGGFDPVHSGHIEMINEARKLGRVIIALNSDEWLARKKGQPFMNFEERKAVLDQFKNILCVIPFDDSDNTACDAINQALNMFPKSNIIFANGGDRTSGNIPELSRFENNERVSFEFGVGGENKKNSSSWILEKWKTNKTERDWGYWRVLDDKGVIKTKELVIHPNKCLSDQKHAYRDEHWYILDGEMMMKLEYPNGDKELIQMKKNDTLVVKRGTWHQACGSDVNCHVLEVQYGEKCLEEDITRR